MRFGLIITAILALLFGVPWWTLVWAGNQWPRPVFVIGTVLVALRAGRVPVPDVRRARPAPPRLGRAGSPTPCSAWSGCCSSGPSSATCSAASWRSPGSPIRPRSRWISAVVALIALVLLLWGYAEAMRVSRVRRIDVTHPPAGSGPGRAAGGAADRHALRADQPGQWSRGVVKVVNSLGADIVAHTGDIADGEVAERREQAAPLGDVRARLARVYVTGNHEYFSGAQGWVDHMASLGWEALHNRHLVVSRDGARLVVAGVDDRTAAGSGVPGHHADHEAALAGADPELPVLLLAHQPQQVTGAVAHGVDLQISGHTHGGQMWPFHYLVRLDQPVLQGLSRHGDRTQLYTSRGTGFWGPPFRIFAPSEITVLTLHAD